VCIPSYIYPKCGWHTLGSKQVYTPRVVVDLACALKTPSPNFKGTNLNYSCIGETKYCIGKHDFLSY
jgi:hypothetical protein